MSGALDPPPRDWHVVFLVIGIAIGLVGGVALAVAVPALTARSGGSPGTPPGSIGSVTAPGCGGEPSTPTGATPSVTGFGADAGSNPTIATSTFDAPAGSTVFVFAGYINSLIGGGDVASVEDSAGDSYALVATTGFSENHTESVFETTTTGSTDLSVSASFTGGDTPMGGSVAAVAVAGPDSVAIAGVCPTSGDSGDAYTVVQDNATAGALYLLGVSGQEKDAPFTGVAGESRLDTGNATAGPWGDGIGYATFSSNSAATSQNLSASLNLPAVWNAIGLALVGDSSHADSTGISASVAELPVAAATWGGRSTPA